VATFLLLLCIGAGCGAIGIVFMIYAPTVSRFPRSRVVAATGPSFNFFTPSFAPPQAAPFIPIEHSLSTDFSAEEPVREVRIRAAPGPALPPVAHAVALPPVPPPKARAAEGTPGPTSPPRLGVSAPQRGRHLAPPPRMTMPPPLPRSRAARGSDSPPINSFATENQRTVPRAHAQDFEPENTFVD
jgi:hypothetical protein